MIELSHIHSNSSITLNLERNRVKKMKSGALSHKLSKPWLNLACKSSQHFREFRFTNFQQTMILSNTHITYLAVIFHASQKDIQYATSIIQHTSTHTVRTSVSRSSSNKTQCHNGFSFHFTQNQQQIQRKFSRSIQSAK